MDKGFEQIIQRLDLNDITLVRVSAEAISPKDPSKGSSLKVEWSCSRKIDDEKKVLYIQPNCKVYFEPEAFCILDLTYSLVYSWKDKTDLSEVDKYIEELLRPCGNLNSLIVCQLMERIVGGPLIIPPKVELAENIF